MDQKTVTVIDIGNKNIGVSVGYNKDEDIEIIGNVQVATTGVKKGIIEDIDKCRNDIVGALKKIEEKFDVDIDQVYIGISSKDIRLVESWGTINLKDGTVFGTDISRAIYKGRRNATIYEGEEIVDCLIDSYKLDGKIFTSSVVGWKGSILELSLTLLIGKREMLNTYRDLFIGTKYNIKGFLISTVSLRKIIGEKINTESIAIIDSGASNTNISIFKNGILKDLVTLPLGGENISKDIAIVSKIPLGEAENIKLIHSSNYESLCEKGKSVEEITTGNTTIGKDILYNVINDRIKDIINYINIELKKSSHYADVCSIILCGEGLSNFENIKVDLSVFQNKKIYILNKQKLGLNQDTKLTSLALLKDCLDKNEILTSNCIDLHKNQNENINCEEKNEVLEEKGFIERMKKFFHDIF